MQRLAAIFLLLALGACAPQRSEPMRVMTWPDLLEQPRPTTPHRIAYGAQPQHFVDVWLPEGAGPHPVVVMVHGGCWTKSIADLSIMNYIAADLRANGVAVWNIEYRGVDETGGGYPGTFLDVAAAADALRDHAARFNLRTDRIVAHGHSAGGHLALWLAARPRLPAWSPMHGGDPLPISAVVSVGGLPDLEASAALGDQSCGADVVAQIAGAPGAARPDVYADTSLARLAPIGVPHYVVNTELDRIAPPFHGRAYAALAGPDATYLEIPGEAHVELIAPESAAWRAERDLILRLAR